MSYWKHTEDTAKSDKLVIEDSKIYIDYQLIPASAKKIITGDVGNFESDESITIIPGDGKT